MRWQAKLLPTFEDQTYWHDWYAWHPVLVDYRFWIWLEKIERRRIHGMTPYGPYPLDGSKWEYREKDERA